MRGIEITETEYGRKVALWTDHNEEAARELVAEQLRDAGFTVRVGQQGILKIGDGLFWVRAPLIEGEDEDMRIAFDSDDPSNGLFTIRLYWPRPPGDRPDQLAHGVSGDVAGITSLMQMVTTEGAHA